MVENEDLIGMLAEASRFIREFCFTCETKRCDDHCSNKQLLDKVNGILLNAMSLERGEKIRCADYPGLVFDFGYVGSQGHAIIYNEGECNMQDAVAVRFDSVERIK